MAGIGSLLLVIGTFVPFLSLVGIILLLVGLRDLARYYGDNGIFDDALYAVMFGVIGIVAVGVVLIGFLLGGLFAGGSLLGITVGIFIGLVVVFIFYILMAVYFRRAFDALADKSGQGMLRTVGLLLLIGAVLTIIVIGLLLIFVAWILATVVFFSMTPKAQPQQPPPPPPPS